MGKNAENAFEEAMVGSVHISCEFRWIELLLKQLKCALQNQ
jgi:hypothetical protein